MQKIPLFIRKFVLDSVETFVGLVLAMSVAFPGSVQEAQALALVFGAAALSAAISAARRAAPAALAALAAFLSVPAGSGE